MDDAHDPRDPSPPAPGVPRRRWLRWAAGFGLSALACQQIWRHGHDYVFAENFAVVEPGRVYRGAWQKPWPMRRIIRDRGIKTIVALAHPPKHPLVKQERELAQSLGTRWIHIPITELRELGDESVYLQIDKAVDAIADPANQPVFFHCHHGVNRASMVHIAYRLRCSGWSLEQATAEIDRTFGLVETSRGPDYRMMADYARRRLSALSASSAGSRFD